LRLVRATLVVVIFCALAGLSIYAFEKVSNKADKLAARTVDNHFHKTVSFELAADDRFEKSAAKLCRFIDKKGESRIEYANEAKQLGALLTARWLEDGCGGDCKTLVNSK
jgi:hypothetical protein